MVTCLAFAQTAQSETNQADQLATNNVETTMQSAPASTAPISAAEAAKLAEDQIPLSVGTVKKSAEAGTAGPKALMSMMIVLILIATTYYFVRRYKISNKINKSNARIQVVSQHYLGPKKSLAIIQVAGESILIGVTDQNISMIKSLSLIDDEVPANLPNTFGQSLAQAEIADTVIENASHSRNSSPSLKRETPSISEIDKKTKTAQNAFELDEEFSFANVTDTVSKKIKSMRSFS
jgi:flagellar protein FliO/FliZ